MYAPRNCPDSISDRVSSHSRLTIRWVAGLMAVLTGQASRRAIVMSRIGTLSKAFGAHVVVDEFSAVVNRGDKIVLVGRNGAGKTTLLRVMAGIYEPVVGVVRSCGRISPMFDIALGIDGVTGLAVWSAVALFCYIVGLSYIARHESAPGLIRYWPCVLLIVPILLAQLVNAGEFRTHAHLLSLIVLLWIVRSIRSTFWTGERNIGRTVSGLLAGIALVDFLSVADVPRETAAIFIGLFLAALLGQRFVPAT